MAAHVTGAVARTWLRTFDVAAPEVEAWLASQSSYNERDVVGVEIIVDTLPKLNLTPELAEATANAPDRDLGGRVVVLEREPRGVTQR